MNKIATTLGAAALSLGLYTQADFPSTMIDPSIQIADYCSGTVIDDPNPTDGIQSTILTARHCVNAVGEVVKIDVPNYVDGFAADEKSYDFTVTYISLESDVALLQRNVKDDDFNLPTASIYKGELEFGQAAWVVGYPLGMPKMITSGFLGYLEKIPALGGMSKSQIFRKFAANIAPGNSGGGLFVKNALGQYELAGTVSAGIMNSFSISTPWASAVPLDELRAFLLNVESESVDGENNVKIQSFKDVVAKAQKQEAIDAIVNTISEIEKILGEE